MTTFFDGKNVLVAGGSGFLGSHFVHKLVELGAHVAYTYFNRRNLLYYDEKIIRADLTKKQECDYVVRGMDYVFMCAAETYGAAVIKNDPFSLVTPNVVMNMLMLDACYKAGVKKVLFISSSVVYPERVTWFANEDEAFDGDPPKVYYHVGWMKRYGEILCKMYTNAKRCMPCVVIRPGNVFGPYDQYDSEKSHVTAALIRKVAERHNPIEVWGDGNDVRHLIYIDDLVEGALLAFEKVDSYDPLNIACGIPYTVKQILETAMRIDDCHSDVVYNASKPSTIKARYLNVSRAGQVLGFHTKTSLEEGLKKTIEWYKTENARD